MAGEEDLSPNAEFEEIAEPGDPEPPTQARSTAPALSEAQRRIRLARYYEAFLEGTIFTNQCPESEQVEAELRDYAIRRMEILLGMRQELPPPSASQFTDLEILALKKLAQRVIDGPNTRSITVKDAPALSRREVSIPSAVTKMNIPPQPEKKPEKPLPPPAIAQKQGMTVKTAATADLGERFAENGQWYVWAQNEAGERYKKSVGGLIHNPAATPMPQGQAMSFVTAEAATRNLATSLRSMENEMSHPKTDQETERMTR